MCITFTSRIVISSSIFQFICMIYCRSTCGISLCVLHRGFYWKSSPCLPSYSNVPLLHGGSVELHPPGSTFSAFRKLQFLLQHKRVDDLVSLMSDFPSPHPPEKKNKIWAQGQKNRGLQDVQTVNMPAAFALMGKTRTTCDTTSVAFWGYFTPDTHIWNGSRLKKTLFMLIIGACNFQKISLDEFKHTKTFNGLHPTTTMTLFWLQDGITGRQFLRAAVSPRNFSMKITKVWWHLSKIALGVAASV